MDRPGSPAEEEAGGASGRPWVGPLVYYAVLGTCLAALAYIALLKD